MAALRGLSLSDPGHADARLPASRKLAEELSVSLMTVVNVYGQLSSEGYITAQAGNGTFVANHLPHLSSAAIRILENHQPPSVAAPFQSRFLDQTLFSHRIWARHRECAWRAPTAGVLALPNPFGWYPLRGAIANHLSAWRGLNCRPEQVLITSGAWEALEINFCGILRGDRNVAIEGPGWLTVREVLGATKTKMFPIRIDKKGFDAGRIPSGLSAAIVTPCRHYPTGIVMPLSR